MTDYRVADDIRLVKELLGLSTEELAREINMGPATISRWLAGKSEPSARSLMSFYGFAFSKGLRLNAIKAQLHKELLEATGRIIVFHGAKSTIEGDLSVSRSRPNNDFGRGFYCGESLEQSAMFVAGYPLSSVYIAGFDPSGLRKRVFHVNQEWMLTIAWFRGRLASYADHQLVRSLRDNVGSVDYVVAPIADNRMFEIIDSFIDGEITDEQCQHCLSATNLGNQYVFLNDRALSQVHLEEHCFLADEEKLFYLDSRKSEAVVGSAKVKVAKRQFRGQGLYIEEILS
ncbi:DUF3990 domain-containing protein [Adlercreutzia sp. ZJ242]|uniref:DUF3990 domain-containing protein n=1 Tax=Adlercreutzia sp. ZJ242 TaxID=2709409 RepID=UPI0013EC319D|nr:DUF3990 domain-containing protein [Adlercreutzia sp. ZJ242]